MKTAISIPDHVFDEAEELARRLEKSRSQLYSEAVAEYVAKHDLDRTTEAMNAAIEEIGTEPDAFVSALTRGELGRVEW